MLRFKQFLKEEQLKNRISEFAKYAQSELGIKELPEIEIIDDKGEALENTTFGTYYPGFNRICINVAGRHIVDILRTLAHELTHHKQNEDGKFDDDVANESGETGSPHENEANSWAGVAIRNYGKQFPEIYEEFSQN